MRTVLFHRDFRGFTGGHLKVWHYFNHVAATPGYQAQIYFTPESRWDESNPWLAHRAGALSAWQPEESDLVFLGGRDWEAIPEAERSQRQKPVVNLVQHVHHGDPSHPMSRYLRYRAIRVCVSAQVRVAIEATGLVNGPAFVIPNGINDTDLPPRLPRSQRPVDWLICGLKEDRSQFARDLARRLAREGGWGNVEVMTKPVLRPDFLRALAAARNVVLLPRETEGFYLPALEAMALGTFLICPDCVGNRSFCLDGINASVPRRIDVDHLHLAMKAVRGVEPLQEELAQGGLRTAAKHTLARERAAFQEVLTQVEDLW